MFRFWSSESRGSEKTSEEGHCQPLLPEGSEPTLPNTTHIPAPVYRVSATTTATKRKLPSSVDTTAHLTEYSSAKRIKVTRNGGLPSPTSASADGEEDTVLHKPATSPPDLDGARDIIQYQFGLEILLKHNELRLINQELAKCQVALEQLRRCHLVPYPLQCPTPSQMLDISSGKGPAMQSAPGQPVPKWAPPFGVVEGPYARHYAKWLIPDPVFDGIHPEPRGVAEPGRSKLSASEGRTTRNSMSDVGSFGRQRPARGQAGQKLQALSSGYPQPKDKQAPCVLKRSDGVTVKLVCIDCHRWDFSSTQGFINHCRIAHRRDFKSHEEAAVHSGHPIEVDEVGAVVGDDSKPAAPQPVSGSPFVHPLARNEPVSEQQAYKALLSRVKASLELYHAGKLPNVKSIPRAPKSPSFVASSEAPYLSRLMQKKNVGGNLKEQVTDAKIKVDWDILSPGDDSDIEQINPLEDAASPKKMSTSAVRVPAVMRVPARSDVSPPPLTSTNRPASSKGRVPPSLGLTATTLDPSPELPETPIYDEEMDVDLSPNTVTSNNAPSLVSDDGEYDDSDDGSSSDSSNDMETESVSDVAEITIDGEADIQDVTPTQSLHCRRGSANTTVKLRKEESKPMTFVTPISNGNNKARRKQKV
ncbi:protein AHC1 [Naviculisporaceae sp. PSN 640]